MSISANLPLASSFIESYEQAHTYHLDYEFVATFFSSLKLTPEQIELAITHALDEWDL
jgi:hypothetical protein